MREGRCAPPTLLASSAWPHRYDPVRAPDLAESGSRGELVQDLFHRLRALGPRRQLGLDADALRADEARVASAAHELDHLSAVERRVLHELQLYGLVGRVDARNAERPRRDAYLVAFEQRARRLGQLAEAVDELLAQGLELLARIGIGEPLVEREPLLHIAAVARGQQRRHVEIDFGIEIEIFFQRWRAARLQCAHRELEHAGVQREADFLDLARLRFAENLA